MAQDIKKPLIWNKKNRKRLFIILMLAYPVAHFLFFWIYINFNSIVLTFQTYVIPEKFSEGARFEFAGFSNYKVLFEEIAVNKYTQNMIWNSLSYAVLNIGIILPLSILAAFVLFKKMPLSNFYRVMFFLPSIIPLAALTITFTAMLDSQQGPLPLLISALGFPAPEFLTTKFNSQITIYLFCIWSGMGYNIILLSSAMARLPMEILESGKLDGVTGMKELFKIYIPLIWPNITTMVMLGLMSVFGVALQPLMLSGSTLNETIGLRIYNSSQASSNMNLAGTATLGLVCTLVAAPVILFIRFVMERFYKDISF